MNRKPLAADGLERLRDAMLGYVERGEVPGLVYIVCRAGEVQAEAIGTMTAGGNDTMRRDAIFRISSMSKPVTAAATLILVEEGLLELDEPVDRLLPELADRVVLRDPAGPLEATVPAVRGITPRDLLTFTMGFGQLMAPPDASPILAAANALSIGMGPPHPSEMPAPDEWIRRLGTLPLMYQPGERWLYNTGSDVLGVLIARASGRSFESFLRERIFERLGMADTAFSVPAEDLDRFCPGYGWDPALGRLELRDPAEGGEWSREPAFASGAAGLVSTVDDYLAFAQMLLEDGKLGTVRILDESSVAAMTSDQLTPAQKAGAALVEGYFDRHGWGFGLSILTAPDELPGSVGAFGWDGGLGTSWRCDPAADLVGILMTQVAWTSADPPPVCRDFWAGVYASVDGDASPSE